MSTICLDFKLSVHDVLHANSSSCSVYKDAGKSSHSVCLPLLDLQAVKGIVKPHAQSSQNAIVSHAQGGSNNTAQQDRKQSADLTASSELLLQLPEVHTMQQARQQVDHLQQQAYFKTRKLQGGFSLSCF